MMMRKLATRIAAAAVGLCLAFSMAGCGQQAATAPAKEAETTAQAQSASTEEKKESKLEKIKKAGKLVIGTSAEYPPYEFHKADANGKDQIVGFDIDIANEIAKDLGVKLEIKDMKFEGLLAALKTDNIDIVIAGMTPSDERKQNFDFTKIYYTAAQSVLVRAEDKDKYKTAESLAGKKVGAQKSSVQEKIANTQVKGASIVALSKIPDLIMELKNKKIDAIVLEVPVANGYISRNQELVKSEIQVTDDTGGSAIAVNKGNEELLAELNKTLDRLMGDKTIDKFVEQANLIVETN